MTPRRIQQRRTAGWTKPEGAISCARPGPYGNPFPVGELVDISIPGPDGAIATVPITPELAVACFANLMEQRLTVNDPNDPEDVAFVTGWRNVLETLRGHDLMCFCSLDQPCHVDVWLTLANPGWVQPDPEKVQPFHVKPSEADTEEWRPIAHHPGYEVSNLGRVRSPRGNFIGGLSQQRGHVRVRIGDELHLVQHLVLGAFAGPRPYRARALRVYDADPTNNRADNLEWGPARVY